MATPVIVSIPHKLGKTEARARVEHSLGEFKTKLGAAGLGQFQHAWNADRLDFRARMLAQTITGRLDVSDTELRIEVDLPGFLAGLADKISGKLGTEGRLLLEKKKV